MQCRQHLSSLSFVFYIVSSVRFCALGAYDCSSNSELRKKKNNPYLCLDSLAGGIILSAYLPFHPLFRQLRVDPAHQVVQGSQGVLALRWVLRHQLGPVKKTTTTRRCLLESACCKTSLCCPSQKRYLCRRDTGEIMCDSHNNIFPSDTVIFSHRRH